MIIYLKKIYYMKNFYIFISLLFCLSCTITPKQREVEPVVVERAYVSVDTLPRNRVFISTITPNYQAVVQPRVNGYLTAKLFDNGMPVKRGEVIFRLDGREQRANLLSAKADLEKAKAMRIEAENNYFRAVPLAAIDAISQAQLDQYTAEYRAAEAAVKSCEQALENARLESEYTVIRASIDGVISTSEAHVGDFVGPGAKFSTLTTIQNIDTVCVDIAIPMRNYLEYSNRRSFTYDNDSLLSNINLYLADGSHYPIEGSYSFTKSAVADSSGTITIVVTFPNPDYLLKAGQFARVQTNVGRAVPRLTVPITSVNNIQGKDFVWVIAADSTVEYRPVRVGSIVGKRVVIESGLNIGESVALIGAAKLTNKQKVKL